MRRTRGILLVAILVILGAVWASYTYRRRAVAERAPTAPKSLPPNVQVAAQEGWQIRKEEGTRPIYYLRAGEMQQVENNTDLKHVELQLFHKDAKSFDRIRSEHAIFDQTAETLFSPGDVEITLGVTVEEEAQGRLLSIRSSGVRVEARSGKAYTEADVHFTLDLGEGRAKGAAYDPQLKQLALESGVELDWRGKPGQKPMRIEAGHAVYDELQSKVVLSPWSKLTRDGLTLQGATSVVSVDKGSIRQVDSLTASGTEKYPQKEIAFGADELRLELNDRSQIEKISGRGKARLDSVTSASRTAVRTDAINLAFQVVDKESQLKEAFATGHSELKVEPLSRPGVPAGGARLLRSEVVQMKMRPGGEEIEAVETHTPGTLDLLPAQPSQPKRTLEAVRMGMQFGANSQLKSFRGVDVKTTTQRPARERGRPDPPPAITTSKDLAAEFNPETGEATKIEQWNNFRYREGDRQAVAEHAVMDQTQNAITLVGAARVWDATGSVNGDRILLNQQNGDFTAEGKVTSTRLPDKQSTSGGMLSEGEPLQSKSDRMVVTDQNRRVRYEGNAVVWQSSNRIEAHTIDINRQDKNLNAAGNVMTQLTEKQPPGSKKARARTEVRAGSLEYSDRDRLAYYKEKVQLNREGMIVKSKELRAYLTAAKAGSSETSLEKALADGDVDILQSASGRTRHAASQHAEYFVADGMVVLTGGNPMLEDSVTGTTTAPGKLTYWANNDSLRVEGSQTQPAQSRIHHK